MTQDATPRRERFERLYDAHLGVVTAWAFRRDPDRERARDLVAETFLVAWRRLDDVPPGDERAWLLGVAGNVRRNQMRGDHRRLRVVERLAMDLPEPPVPAPRDEIDPRLAEALRRLPDRDRELILLIAWEELEVAEAARALGMTAVAARVRLHRARRRLETALRGAPAVPGASTVTEGTE